MIKFKTKILRVSEAPEGVWTYALEIPQGFGWDEGTHMHVANLGFDEGDAPNRDQIRHMSVMSLPTEGYLGFTTKIDAEPSEFKSVLKDLKEGDSLVLFKFGSRMVLRREERPILLLSMGVGIATMRPLILKYKEDQSGISELYSINVNGDGDYVYYDEIEPLVGEGFDTVWCRHRTEYYERLADLVKAKNPICYVVGNDAFIKDHILKLRNLKVSDNDIIVDKKPEIRRDYYHLRD